MAWFAVRSVYLWGRKSDGTNVFEERVLCFQAGSPDEAYAKAKRESDGYAAANRFDVHPERDAYELDDDALIDGHEVWSLMLESRQPLPEFYRSRYSDYEYHPE